MTKEEKRVYLVSTAIEMGKMSLDDAIEYDTIVCGVLGIDPEENCPNFIFTVLGS